MSHVSVRARASALWFVVTAAAAAVAALTGGRLTRLPSGDFTSLLTWACAAGAAAAVAGLWLLTTEVVLSVLADPTTGRAGSGRVVGPVRGLLLAVCGVVALSSPAAAGAPGQPAVVVAQNDQRSGTARVLDGLRLPDRAVDAGDGTPSREQRIVVRPGDCLWTIAEQRLGARAGVAEVATYWQRIYALNRDVIGPDPDLILPGQRLTLPPVG